MDWLAMGCIFVGVVNYSIIRSSYHDWSDRARRDVSLCNGITYSLWSLRNAAICPGLNDDGRYTVMMWTHASVCGIVAIWNMLYIIPSIKQAVVVALTPKTTTRKLE
jgi:hypothetical protein